MMNEVNRFRVTMNSMGRVAIPMKCRDSLRIDPGDVLTITIDEVFHWKDWQRKMLRKKIMAGFNWLFGLRPSVGHTT